MRYRSTVIAGLLFAGLLAGCSSGTTPPASGEPPLPESIPQVDMSTFTLPLDAYEPTHEQNRIMYEARSILMVRCMAKFGFTLEPPQPGEPSPGGPNERRYLIHSDARAQTYGYKWPEITNQKRTPEPDLPPGGIAALTGDGASQIGGLQVPEGGCMGEATRTLSLGANPNSGIAMLRQLGNDAYKRMEDDSRVKSAIARWSACMQAAGYHYPDPARANNDPAFGGDTASPAEIATATADVKCKNETSLINLMAAVETAYQKRAIEQHQQQLADLKTSTENQVKQAADVIAGKK